LPEWEKSSTARVIPPARPRKLAKVPFVELADGRLQGVVSSGSDIERVYVSSVAADGIYSFGCSTNNNRPCGGARVEVEEPTAQAITTAMLATHPSAADALAAASVFSRFLRHLAYLELTATTEPLPEMQWFPPTREVA
jgi:hypothetical protein